MQTLTINIKTKNTSEKTLLMLKHLEYVLHLYDFLALITI